mgnify:FL=1
MKTFVTILRQVAGRTAILLLVVTAVDRPGFVAAQNPDQEPSKNQENSDHSGSTGGDENVIIRTDEGQTEVGRTYAKVGQKRVVLLPDGTLIERGPTEITVTERPFEPLSKDLLAARLTAGLPGFQTRQSRRYLYVYNTSAEFALATSRILETMYPGVVAYAEAQQIDVSEPELPLVALMFRTEAQFQEYQRMPPGVVAYYNVLTNRVVMYEESKLQDLKPELAIQQSIATIAHEGAHQVLNNIGVQKRLSVWPMWLSEGLAEFFAPTSTDRRLKWKGAGQVNDMRMFELEQYIKGRAADVPNGKMVADTVAAARLTSTGYASAWALTHYLAKNERVAFNRYVREVSKLGPFQGLGKIRSPGIIPENLSSFREHFDEDLETIERRLVLHLRKQPYVDPFADWPHFAALVGYTDGNRTHRDANVFHSETMATRWIEETEARIPETHRPTARHQIRTFQNRALAERAAREFLGGR